MKKKENQLQQKEKPIASKKSVRFSPSLRVSECYKYDALTQQLCQSSRQPPPPNNRKTGTTIAVGCLCDGRGGGEDLQDKQSFGDGRRSQQDIVWRPLVKARPRQPKSLTGRGGASAREFMSVRMCP